MCIATRCTSVEQFIQMFHRFVDEESFFVSTLNTRPPGLETPFSVQLVDGTPVLRGLCVVMQAWTTAANPFKTPGVRLGIKRLTANSMQVFERLLVTRSAAKTPVPPVRAIPAPPALPKPPPLPLPSSSLPTAPAAAIAAPSPQAKSPFTETAPRFAPPRIELKKAVPEGVVAEPVHEQHHTEPTKVRPPRQSTLPEDTKVDTKVDPKSPMRATTEEKTVERTPGSELVLPANPLMNLTDESLEGYVDCTLYEETGNFFPAEDDATFMVDDVAAPPPDLHPVPTAAKAPLPASRDSGSIDPTPLPPPQVDTNPGSERRGSERRLEPAQTHGEEPSIIVETAGTPAMPPPQPPREAPPLDAPLIARGSMPALTEEPEPLPVATATPAERLVPAPHKRPRWWVLGGVGVLAAAVVVLTVTTTSSDGSDSREAPEPQAKVETRAEKPAPAEPEPAPAEAEPAVADHPQDPPPGAGPPLVGSGPCKVVVASTPAGSMVKLDGKTLAPSPITVATTCDKHRIDVVHPRYQTATKLVTLEQGQPASVDLSLSRPTHTLTVTSQPPGATVFIDGRRAGTTPTKLNVLGFMKVKYELKKTGYQPATATHYSKVANDKLVVRLTKW